MKLVLCSWTFTLATALLNGQTGVSGPAGALQEYALTQFVGSATDTIQAMTSDSAGHIYIAGTTSSPDLPVLNAAQPAIGGGSDAFVAKLDSSGDIIWSTFLGGTAADAAVSIALDATGNVYVTGNTASPDFPATQPRVGTQGQQNVFTAEFDPNGILLYSVVLGGEKVDTVSGMCVDPRGDAYLAGRTTSASFPVTRGGFQVTPAAGFVVRLAEGGQVTYVSYLPLSQVTTLPFFPLSPQPPVPPVPILAEVGGSALVGGSGSILRRISPDGSTMTTVVGLPGPVYSLAADTQGNVYVAGQTSQSLASTSCFIAYFDHIPVYMPPGDTFVMKLQAGTFNEIYSEHLAGVCQSSPNAIAVAGNGEVVLGIWSWTQFEAHNPVLMPISWGCSFSPGGKGAVARLSADGSLLFSSNLDMCGAAPPIALGPDESILAAVSNGGRIAHAAIVQLPVAQGPMAVENIYHSFSAEHQTDIYFPFSGAPGLSYLVPGTLLTISGENLAPGFVDLGLNDPMPLPTDLGGVQVLFNRAAAQLFQVAPDHIIFVVPDAIQSVNSIQVRNGGESSTPFLLALPPVQEPVPILLTSSFPALPPAVADGIVRNADGSSNDAQHPAALGSTVTLYANGLEKPGPVRLTWNPVPCTPNSVCEQTVTTGTASTIPGFINVLYQIKIAIPSAIRVLPAPVSGGVSRVVVAAGNRVGIYVK